MVQGISPGVQLTMLFALLFGIVILILVFPKVKQFFLSLTGLFSGGLLMYGYFFGDHGVTVLVLGILFFLYGFFSLFFNQEGGENLIDRITNNSVIDFFTFNKKARLWNQMNRKWAKEKKERVKIDRETERLMRSTETPEETKRRIAAVSKKSLERIEKEVKESSDKILAEDLQRLREMRKNNR